MRKHVGWLSGIVAGLALAAGTAGAAPQAADTDESITERVQASLAQDAQFAANAINVSTRNGMVHMQGKVPSADAAKRAIHLAEATDGVRGVWVDFEAVE